MPRNVAQWTGLCVTAIIVFGCDLDVIYAVPLGVMAGAIVTFVVALTEYRAGEREPIKVSVRVRD